MKQSKNAVQIRKVEMVFDDVEKMRSEIAQKAYDIFLERGGHSGWEMDDWLAAERELAWKPPVELCEEAGEFVIVCRIPGVDLKDVDVQVTAEDLLIESKTAGHTHRMRILSLGLVCLIVFFLASVSSIGQESASRAKAERVNAAIKELAEGAQSSQRVQAAELLGQSRDRRAARPLIAALRDSDPGVQRVAAAALGQLRDPLAVEPLLGILRMNSEPLVRSAAAFALGLIQDRKAVDPLIGALQDSDIGVRMNSALSLGRLGDPRAVEPLLALPHDKEHQACISIALALGQLKSEKAIKPLLDGLNDANPDVCRNSSIALVLIGGKGQVDPLITALQSHQPVVRRSAVFALGLLGDRKATLPLVELLRDGDVTVRLNTVEALGRLKDRRSVEPLRGVAQSDSESSVREGARSAMAKVLSPEPPARERKN